MSIREKLLDAIGRQRPNSPSMVPIETMQIYKADYTYAVGTGTKVRKLAIRWRPYTDSHLPTKFGRFTPLVRW
ncbi:hypothetical protein DBR00_10760 [Pseudomonas sp. HMWF032]|nr:hypothetical protein DBR00_10760 [Pseudomonas sp. HMWF032]PTT85575.1 hypothetical protein DBR41_03460 [Pseudomonas sp. HMWF010]